MHELSIISSVVESVIDSLAAYPGARVIEVRLRVGALSAVVLGVFPSPVLSLASHAANQLFVR